MPDLTQKPTSASIDDALGHLERTWGNTHNEWAEFDSLYHRTFAVWAEKFQDTRSSYRPSRATSVIDHAADTQMAFEPRVHREPLSDSDISQQAADKVEIALKAILDDSALMEITHPYKQIGRHLLHYGYAVREGPMWDEADRPREPKRDQGELDEDWEARQLAHKANVRNWNPIRIKATNPGRVLMDPMQKQPKYAIKRTKMLAWDLHQLTVAKKHPRSTTTGRVLTRRGVKIFTLEDGQSEFETVDVVHWWTREWDALMVKGGDVLWVLRNAAGFVPFDHAYAGFGMEPANMNEVDPKFLAVGLLGPIADSLRVAAQRMSGSHELLIKAAYAPMGTRLDPTEAAEQLNKGEILQGEADDYWVMKANEVQRWMSQYGAEVDADIEQGTYTRSLAGLREPGVSTVGQQSILSTAAQRKFSLSAMQLQHLASLGTSKILQLVYTKGKTIGAEGKVLSPKDIAGNFNVKTTFEVIDPVLELQRRELGMREVETGLKAKETYWLEDARRNDGTMEQKRLWKQLVREHPAVASRMALILARKMGLEEEFRAAVQQQVGQNGPQAPNGAAGRAVDGILNPQPDEFGIPESDRQAARELRQPLSPDTAKPARIG